MKRLLLTTIVLLAPSLASGQVVCVPLGKTIVCNGPNAEQTIITSLSPHVGVIQTDRAVTPYTVLPSTATPPLPSVAVPTVPLPVVILPGY